MGTTSTAVANKAYADTKVSLTGNQAIAGVKDFAAFPTVPIATDPTADNQVVSKKYADSLAFNITRRLDLGNIRMLIPAVKGDGATSNMYKNYYTSDRSMTINVGNPPSGYEWILKATLSSAAPITFSATRYFKALPGDVITSDGSSLHFNSNPWTTSALAQNGNGLYITDPLNRSVSGHFIEANSEDPLIISGKPSLGDVNGIYYSGSLELFLSPI